MPKIAKGVIQEPAMVEVTPALDGVLEITDAKPEKYEERLVLDFEGRWTEPAEMKDKDFRWRWFIASDDDPKAQKDETWTKSNAARLYNQLKVQTGVGDGLETMDDDQGYAIPKVELSSLKNLKVGVTTKQRHDKKGFVQTDPKKFWKPGLVTPNIHAVQLENRPQSPPSGPATSSPSGRKFED